MSYEGDGEILEITKALCQQLNITNYNPTSVSWKTVIQKVIRGAKRQLVLPYDQCILLRDGLILPAAMKDRLEPDEWTPIIASILIYEKVFRHRRSRGRALIVVSWILLAAALLPILRVVFSAGGGSLVWVYLLLTMIFGFLIVWMRHLKGLRARADRESSKIVGTARFVAVLEKVSSLDTTGEGKTRNRRGVGAVWPLLTIQQRVSNLQTNLVSPNPESLGD